MLAGTFLLLTAALGLSTAGSAQAVDAHKAMARLLSCYFDKGNPHREAGCKAWLLVLLNALIQEFRDSALQRVELLQRQKQSDQLKPVFDHVREHYASRVSLKAAARMCGLSPAQFPRTFKQVSGMRIDDLRHGHGRHMASAAAADRPRSRLGCPSPSRRQR